MKIEVNLRIKQKTVYNLIDEDELSRPQIIMKTENKYKALYFQKIYKGNDDEYKIWIKTDAQIKKSKRLD